MTASEWDVVLASASAARAGLLANAGLTARSIAGLVQTLADLKADDVVAQLGAVARPTIVLAADSMFRFDGELLGKPGDAQTATRRLAALSGRTGHLLTGHTVVVRQPDGRDSRAHEVAATEIWFAEFDDAELAAYVATGEPLNVIGLSLPLIRRLLADLGVFWPDLWAQS